MSLLKSCTSWLWANVKVSWPLWLALISTGFFGVWTFLLAIEVTLQDATLATRWEHFLNGRPNELGDTLAGFVGSLTLIWVVASVFQQSMELKAQRREFEKMVEAQDAQVAALVAQTELLKSERELKEYEHKQRSEQAADALSTRLVEGITVALSNLSGRLSWQGRRVSSTQFLDGPTQYVDKEIKINFDVSTARVQEYIDCALKEFLKVRNGHRVFGGDAFYGKSNESALLHRLIEEIDNLKKNSDLCSSSERQNLQNIRIFALSDVARQLVEADIWNIVNSEGLITP
ncbi:hypothetical protein MASR2M74_23780 [Paracoccaceae bacterium]